MIRLSQLELRIKFEEVFKFHIGASVGYGSVGRVFLLKSFSYSLFLINFATRLKN